MDAKPTRREIASWCFFDFANSSYTTIIVTVVFPLYFTRSVAEGIDHADFLFGTAFSLSQWLVLLSAPLIGAIADIHAAKKKLLIASTLLCVLATFLLGALPPSLWVILALFVVGTVAYSSGENIVAGFLPEISTRKTIGRISGISWGIGYFGGLLCLVIVNFLISSDTSVAGVSGARLAFIATALFFAISALPTFLFLKERKKPEPLPPGSHLPGVAFRKVAATLREARANPRLWRFLFVFFIYSCGISTVIAFAGIYAGQVIGYSQEELIRLFIALQIASALGAFFFGWLQDRIGARLSIQATLVLWTLVASERRWLKPRRHFSSWPMSPGSASGAANAPAAPLSGNWPRRTSPARVLVTGDFSAVWLPRPGHSSMVWSAQ